MTMRLLIVLICLLPIFEIAGFVIIGGKIGLGLTLLWLLAAGTAGLALIRHGGLNALAKLQTALQRGQEPGHSLIDGAVMVSAGLLLILPGFFSDILALILLLPVTRDFLLRRAAHHFETKVYRTGSHPAERNQGAVIDGEFDVIEPETDLHQSSPSKPMPRIIDQDSDKS